MTTTDPADERMREIAYQRAEAFIADLTGRAEQEYIRSVMTNTIAEARIRGDGPWATADTLMQALDREGYTVAARSVVRDARETPPSQPPRDHQEANGAPHGTPARPGAAEGAETISEPRCGRAMVEGSCPDHPPTEPTVTVRQTDLAEVLRYVIGAGPICVVTNETLDRLFADLKEAQEDR